ncbi:MAG: penicillin-binding protein 2 [Phycisphaerales bacterium]
MNAARVKPRVSPRADRVARWTVGGMTCILVLLLARVVQLQLSPGERLRGQTQARLTRAAIPAPRGELTDRLGRPVATTEHGYRVFVDPVELASPDEAIPRLAEALGRPVDELGARILWALAENQRRAGPDAAAAAPAKADPGVGDMLSRIVLAAFPEPPPPDLRLSPEDPAEALPASGPLRYLRVSGILDEVTVDAVRRLGLKGVHLEERVVRQYPALDLGASIIGKVDIENRGAVGSERAHDADLTGAGGRIFYVRDARGRPLWISPGAYEPAQSGRDVRLSIDLELQRIATEELRRGIHDADAAGGRAVLMDPRTGEVLAMVDLVRPVPDAVPFPWADAAPGAAAPASAGARQRYITLTADPGRLVHPALARNRCVEDVYEPGSTFKPFVWATITELGLARLDEPFNTENGQWRAYGSRSIRDVVRRPTMTWTEVLVNSSNIGMAKAGERLSFDQLHGAVRRFGFGSRTSLALPGETAGLVTPRKQWSKYTQTSVCFGHEIAVTPVQMARAFCVFARSGDLAGTLPEARLTAVTDHPPPMLNRVLRGDVALRTRAILQEIAAAMEARMAANKGTPETGWRYGLFGKSGTAEIPLGKAPKGKRRPPGNKGYFEHQYNASFIGGAPIDDPRLVVLVVIDDPGPERVRNGTYYGSHVAGPVVRRITERSLFYLGVPPAPALARANMARAAAE